MRAVLNIPSGGILPRRELVWEKFLMGQRVRDEVPTIEIRRKDCNDISNFFND